MTKIIQSVTLFFLLAAGWASAQDPWDKAFGLFSQSGASSAAPGLGQGARLLEDGRKIASPLQDAMSEMGPVQQYQLGREVGARLLGAYPAFPASHPASVYLGQVGSTVALASNHPYPYLNYIFILLDSPEINAFATPGGFVFVTSGMMKFLTSEEELAAILGHEVAHVELQHGILAVGKDNSIKLAMAVKDVGLSHTNVEAQVGSQAMQALDALAGQMTEQIRTGYSVELEAAADRRSVAIARNLGYDSLALAKLLARFKQVTNSYGGAKYPADREARVRTTAQTLTAGAPPFNASPVRDARFLAVVGTLK